MNPPRWGLTLITGLTLLVVAATTLVDLINDRGVSAGAVTLLGLLISAYGGTRALAELKNRKEDPHP